MKRLLALAGIVISYFTVSMAAKIIVSMLKKEGTAEGLVLCTVLSGVAMLLYCANAVMRFFKWPGVRNIIHIPVVAAMAVAFFVLALSQHLVMNIIWYVALASFSLVEIKWLFQWH